MLPTVNGAELLEMTTGAPCLLAEHLGMNSVSKRGPAVPVSCASGGEACALCAHNTAVGEAPGPGARPSCAKAGALHELLLKNLLWRQ